jgi:hypothetical protein
MRASTNVAWLVCIAAAAHGESNAHKLTRAAHAHTICSAICCMFCTMPATQCNFTARCCARQLWTARSRGLCSTPKLHGSEFTCLRHPPTVGPCATSTTLWIRCQQQCTSQPPNSSGPPAHHTAHCVDHHHAPHSSSLTPLFLSHRIQRLFQAPSQRWPPSRTLFCHVKFIHGTPWHLLAAHCHRNSQSLARSPDNQNGLGNAHQKHLDHPTSTTHTRVRRILPTSPCGASARPCSHAAC